MAKPLTREEKYLNAIANSQNINLKPITREEIFLAKASGQDITTPTPITRREMFLSKISNGSKPEQEKKVEITSNGTVEITADEGHTLSKVTANVNVPTASGENKLPQFVDGTLTEITAEDLEGITTIRKNAFYNSGLNFIEIPKSVTSLQENAFYYSGVKDVYYDGTMSDWNNNMLFSGGTEATPSNYTKKCVIFRNEQGEYEAIGEHLIIPEGWERVNSHTFAWCQDFTSITIPSTCKMISIYAFYYCSGVTQLNLSEGLEWINSQAFYSMPNLTSVTVPSTVHTLGSNALNVGSSNNKVTFTFLGTTPPSIQSNSLCYTNYIEKIIVPKGCGEAYKTATNWSNLANYIEEATE